MAIIRKLEKKIWLDKQIAEREGWAKSGEICADALKNFKTIQNAISVFEFDGTEKERNKIIAAIIASPNGISVGDTDFAIFDQDLLNDLGLSFSKTPGDTLDREVNSKHLDISNLSANKLVKFITEIQQRATLGRIKKKQLASVISERIASGYIDKTKISQNIINSMERYLS